MDDPGTRRPRIPAWLWVTLAVLAAGAAAATGNALLLGGVSDGEPVGRLSPRMAGISRPATARPEPARTAATPVRPPAVTDTPLATTTRESGDDHPGGDGDEDD